MSLQSTAQIMVFDPSAEGTPMETPPMHLVPLEVSEHEHDPRAGSFPSPEGAPILQDQMEVVEPGEVSIVIEDLPGAPSGTKDPEPVLEVAEEDGDKAKAVDENPAEAKKNEKWDWSARGPHGFIAWVKERCDDVPKHSGYDSAGLERAVAYLERLDGEISKAMRMDLDSELDANQIEKVRAMIDEGVERLHDRLDKVKKVKKTKRSKKKSNFEMDDLLVKEAQKITGVSGIIVTVDLLTSRIARTCINSMVSAGHDIEDVYAHQVKEYNLNKREQASVMQLLSDMGYALRQDRGYMPDEDYDFASSDNADFAANYKG